MKTISKQSDNMGGVIRMWAVPPGDITVSGKTVTIVSDANMIDIYIKEDTGTFSEDLQEADKVYKVKLEGLVPCDNETSRGLISEMERILKYVVIYIDGNGNYKLAGTVDVPLRVLVKATTGLGAAALNHYAVSFSGLQKERAIFINNPF
jgi:hypothetical protein